MSGFRVTRFTTRWFDDGLDYTLVHVGRLRFGLNRRTGRWSIWTVRRPA
jgi:hypothetical protein